jgi:pentatricopeptide repeat protein
MGLARLLAKQNRSDEARAMLADMRLESNKG